jgi:hypothetical protein
VPPALDTVTAQDLAQFCVGSDHVSQNVCRIYILGIAQGVALGMGMKPGQPRPCVPPELTAEALEARVKERLEQDLTASPKGAGEDAARYVTRVLSELYRCPASPAG